MGTVAFRVSLDNAVMCCDDLNSVWTNGDMTAEETKHTELFNSGDTYREDRKIKLLFILMHMGKICG